MSIRILVNGATGKMGQMTANTLKQHTEFEVVGATSRHHDLATEIKKTNPQIVIDFTTANVVLKNTEIIINAGVHPIIGTSGLIKEDVARLQSKCAEQKLGGIIAPNFSLGAVLLMKHAQEIAKYFSYVEIIEAHHAEKLDSPSGTSLRTAELIAQTRRNITSTPPNTKETIQGARGAKHQHINIHSLRLPGIIAQEEVIFGDIGETLSIKHNAADRQCFMSGVILACKKVLELDKLVLGLEHIL